ATRSRPERDVRDRVGRTFGSLLEKQFRAVGRLLEQRTASTLLRQGDGLAYSAVEPQRALDLVGAEELAGGRADGGSATGGRCGGRDHPGDGGSGRCREVRPVAQGNRPQIVNSACCGRSLRRDSAAFITRPDLARRPAGPYPLQETTRPWLSSSPA